MDIKEPYKTTLAHLPTPFMKLKNISGILGGPDIFMKRDDLTGLASGGNKSRKLEYLIHEALACGADIVLTAGAVQSNHCRQTAAACARAGLPCVLLLGGQEPEIPEGNHLLDLLCGASIIWTGEDRRGEGLEDTAAALAGEGKKPFIIPYGGSSPAGACGYVFAMKEFMKQLRDFNVQCDSIVFATSSCGTQAGMVLGARLFGYTGSITGISVDAKSGEDISFREKISGLCNETAALIGTDQNIFTDEIDVIYDYSYPGYGVVTDLERKAISLMARHEGILLDPVYTARAFGGLMEMIAKGKLSRDSNVLFWHTGGLPAIFSYGYDIINPC